MQIPVTLIIFGRAAAQLLAKQAVNVLEEKLALVAQRIAEHLANIIDRQAGGAAPDPIEYCQRRMVGARLHNSRNRSTSIVGVGGHRRKGLPSD
jgi:hypothetical protein